MPGTSWSFRPGYRRTANGPWRSPWSFLTNSLPRVVLSTADEYRDGVIEAFAPAGWLVASVRFDSGRDSPYPAGGNIWVRPTEDELTLVMLD